MDSVELYRQLLGLTTPWTVERVELDMAKQHVEVHVGHRAGQRFACPARPIIGNANATPNDVALIGHKVLVAGRSTAANLVPVFIFMIPLQSDRCC